MRQCAAILGVAVLYGAAALWAASPAATGPTSRPAGEAPESIERTLLERPPVPVTPPEGGGAPAPAKAQLPPMGAALVDFACRMRGNGDKAHLIARLEALDAEKGQQAYWVLPCRLLERMEEAAARRRGVTFRVSGEITVYRGRQFVLPRKAVAVVPRPAKPKKNPTPPAKSPEGGGATTAHATTRPASSDEVIEHLRSDEIERPLLIRTRPPEGTVTTAPSVAPVRPVGRQPPAASELIVDRLVRILPDAKRQWWLARFESDNTLRDQPIRLLPCRFLEQAERTWARGVGETETFRISGEVTVYRGRRYLLLRKLLRERGMGRF